MRSLIAISCLLLCLACKMQQRTVDVPDPRKVRDTLVTGMDTVYLSAFLVDYLGEYTQGRWITTREEQLYYVDTLAGKEAALNRIGKDVFHLATGDATIRFFRNNVNQVMAFRIVWTSGRKEYCKRKGPVYRAE